MPLTSTVEVDPPSHSAYIIRWVQPCYYEDLAEDWMLGADRVQRQRLTGTPSAGKPMTYLCHVVTNGVADGPTVPYSIVSSGAAATPEVPYAGAIPALAGLVVIVRGQNGTAYRANLDAPLATDTLIDGEYVKMQRRWVHCTNAADKEADGVTLAVPFGVHVYLTFRADQPELIQGAIRVTNAAINVGSNGAATVTTGPGTPGGGGTTDFYGRSYFNNIEFTTPTGWTMTIERPIIPNGTHTAIPWSGTPGCSSSTYDPFGWAGQDMRTGNVFPPRFGFTRHFVLYKGAATQAMATALMEMRGVGRTIGIGAERSYFTVPIYGPQQTLLPKLPDTGYDTHRSNFQTKYTNLHNRLFFGTNPSWNVTWSISQSSCVPTVGGLSDEYPYYQCFGPFHPVSFVDTGPGAPGGFGIWPTGGWEYVRQMWRWARLAHDSKMEGSAVWCLHRATGRPVNILEFAQGASPYNYYGPLSPPFTQGQPWQVDYNDDRVPWHYDLVAPGPDSAICRIPGMIDSTIGAGDPPAWGPFPPERPLNDTGSCSFESWVRSHGAWEASTHFIRAMWAPTALVWGAGCLIAADDFRMMGINAGYAYSDIGQAYGVAGDYDPAYTYGVKDQYDFLQIDPARKNRGYFFLGRRMWPSIAIVTLWQLSDDTNASDHFNGGRDLVTPWLQQIIDFYLESQTPSGLWQHAPSSFGGEYGQVWTVYGAPLEATMASIGIESPITMHVLWCCAITVGLTADTKNALVASVTNLFRPELFTPSEYDPGQLGWAKYAGVSVGPVAGVSADDFLANAFHATIPTNLYAGPSSVATVNGWLCYEYAYRASGNPTYLDQSFFLGYPSDPGRVSYEQRAQNFIQGGADMNFMGGLCAWMDVYPDIVPDTYVSGGTTANVTAAVLIRMAGSGSATVTVGFAADITIQMEPTSAEATVTVIPASGGGGGGTSFVRSLRVSSLLRIALASTGLDALADGHDLIQLVNYSGEHLVNMHRWRWLDRPPIGMTSTAGRTFILLPDDFMHLLSLDMGTNQSGSVHLVTYEELIRARRNQVSVSAYTYLVALAHQAGAAGGSAPLPQLELYPTPTTSTASLFTMVYRAGWVRVSDDGNYVSIPRWLEPLYLEVLKAFVQGYEERDREELSTRLERISRSQMFNHAVRRDAMVQQSYGRQRNGAVQNPESGFGDELGRSTIIYPS